MYSITLFLASISFFISDIQYIVLYPTAKNDRSIGYKVDLLISGLDFLQVDIGFALLAEVLINSYLNGKSL